MDKKDWSKLQVKWAVVPGSRLLGASGWLWTAFDFATGRSWVEAGQQLSRVSLLQYLLQLPFVLSLQWRQQ